VPSSGLGSAALGEGCGKFRNRNFVAAVEKCPDGCDAGWVSEKVSVLGEGVARAGEIGPAERGERENLVHRAGKLAGSAGEWCECAGDEAQAEAGEGSAVDAVERGEGAGVEIWVDSGQGAEDFFGGAVG